MHFYACPYCDPCATAILTRKKAEEKKCKYDKEESCAEDHKCKDIMVCGKCKSEFAAGIKFLREQKRKIKDG